MKTFKQFLIESAKTYDETINDYVIKGEYTLQEYKAIKKFIKKLNAAMKYVPYKGLTDSWWRRFGQPLQDAIDNLWDKYPQAAKKFASEQQWDTSKPSVGDLLA